MTDLIDFNAMAIKASELFKLLPKAHKDDCRDLCSYLYTPGKGSQRAKNLAHKHDQYDRALFSGQRLSRRDDAWDNRRG